MSVEKEFGGDNQCDALVVGPKRNGSHSRFCYEAGDDSGGLAFLNK